LDWLIFAAPDAVKTAASSTCKVHNSAFIVISQIDSGFTGMTQHRSAM
jgi:hypothetical protein